MSGLNLSAGVTKSWLMAITIIFGLADKKVHTMYQSKNIQIASL